MDNMFEDKREELKETLTEVAQDMILNELGKGKLKFRIKASGERKKRRQGQTEHDCYTD